MLPPVLRGLEQYDARVFILSLNKKFRELFANVPLFKPKLVLPSPCARGRKVVYPLPACLFALKGTAGNP